MKAKVKYQFSGFLVLKIMLVTIISKILGLSRDLSLSYTYGVSEIADIYIIAMTIPGVIFGFVSTAINTCFIPNYQNICLKKNRFKANRFVFDVTFVMMIFCTILVAVVFLFSDVILKAFGYEYNSIYYILVKQFIQLSIFQVYFSSFASILSSYLQANNKILITIASGIPLDLALIISIFLSAKNIYILPMGFVCSYGLQAVFLLKEFRKTDYRSRRTEKAKEELQIFIKQVTPVILGVSVNQINFLIDRILASNYIVGGVSALNYAHKLELFVQSMFVTSFIAVFYPKLSTQFIEKRKKEFERNIFNTLGNITLFIFPVMIGCYLLSELVIQSLFGRGAFTEQAVRMTSGVFKYYSLGFLAFSIREVFSRVFFSIGDMLTPVRNAGIGMGLNIVFNCVFIRIWGINGLAIATTLSAIITAGLMVISIILKFKYRSSFLKFSLELSKAAAAAIIMGGVIWGSNKIFYFHDLKGLFFLVIISAIIYLALMHIFQSDLLKKFLKVGDAS